MKTKAQGILEYVVLVAIIAAALAAMQLYFKRAIQATIKVTADEMGAQKNGAMDYDYKYEWKLKGAADTTTSSVGASTTKHMEDGAVSYGKNETTTQGGLLSWGIFQEKE